ncbi:MAG: hypothetical protein QE263_01440 [Vampirovibrionales bacterium]|nr:hypothetical protein [Vampirovibrionales bacterium]
MRVQFGDVRFKFNNYGYSHGNTSDNNKLIRTTVSSMMSTVKQNTQLKLTYKTETVEGSTGLFYRISPENSEQDMVTFDKVIGKFMRSFSKINNRIKEVTVIEPKLFSAEI